MKKLLLLVLINSTQAQNFEGTVFDLDSGRVQVISGNIEKSENILLQTLRRANAELETSNARLDAEITAMRQLNEMRKQTRLLEEIASK